MLLPFSRIIFLRSFYFYFYFWAEFSVSNRTFKAGLSLLVIPNDLLSNSFEVVGLFLNRETKGWAGDWDDYFYFFFWSNDWRNYGWTGYYRLFTKGLSETIFEYLGGSSLILILSLFSDYFSIDFLSYYPLALGIDFLLETSTRFYRKSALLFRPVFKILLKDPLLVFWFNPVVLFYSQLTLNLDLLLCVGGLWFSAFRKEFI
jgi:hypothetical protein